jgi:hypothetical protein
LQAPHDLSRLCSQGIEPGKQEDLPVGRPPIPVPGDQRVLNLLLAVRTERVIRLVLAA